MRYVGSCPLHGEFNSPGHVGCPRCYLGDRTRPDGANGRVLDRLKARITRWMQNGSGGRSLGLRVNGITVLVSPSGADEQEAAEALAALIAGLGLAERQVAPRVEPSVKTSAPEPPKREPFRVGERARCIVHGKHEGWYTVSAVKDGGRYIKVEGLKTWNPAYNFARQPKSSD